MENNYAFFNVYFEDTLISSELVLYGPSCCYSFLGGTDRNYYNLHPNHFLKFNIMLWAKAKGLKYFVLGGGLGEDGIFNYKKDMAPNGVVPFYISTKIFNDDKYDYLCNISNTIRKEGRIKDNFFPRYRDL